MLPISLVDSSLERSTQIEHKLMNTAAACKYSNKLQQHAAVDEGQETKPKAPSEDKAIQTAVSDVDPGTSPYGVTLDLRRYVGDDRDGDLQMGKGRYDKNIHLARGEQYQVYGPISPGY